MEPITGPTRPEAIDGIFCVESHRDNREFLAVFLGMAGYAVTSCESIPEAAKIVRDRHFSVYIVGDCLPSGSNLSLAGEIRAMNPHAPLILYSALAFANDIARGLKSGADAYITKPGNLDCFLSTIKRLLSSGGAGQAGTGDGLRFSECGSAQSLRGIQPVSDGALRCYDFNPIVRHRVSAAIAKPTVRPCEGRRPIGPR